jgi:hypothetical protein
MSYKAKRELAKLKQGKGEQSVLNSPYVDSLRYQHPVSHVTEIPNSAGSGSDKVTP